MKIEFKGFFKNCPTVWGLDNCHDVILRAALNGGHGLKRGASSVKRVPKALEGGAV